MNDKNLLFKYIINNNNFFNKLNLSLIKTLVYYIKYFINQPHFQASKCEIEDFFIKLINKKYYIIIYYHTYYYKLNYIQQFYYNIKK